MPVAKWARINPAGLLLLGQRGGVMLMGVAAKKHVTIFPRSRRAPGAGKASVKAAFTAAAHKTLGIGVRAERNAIVASAVKGTGDGIYRRKSRAKVGSPLHGHVYETHSRK